MQERKALGRGRTLALGRKPDFEAQLSPGLGNRAKERRPGSLDPELLGGEGEPYPITHFSHGGQAKKTHLKSYQGREGSQLSNWNIHWASEPPKSKSGGLPQRQDFEDRKERTTDEN
nr:hypothetical protein [Solanum melongena]